MEVYEFAGSLAAIGEQFGEACREEIRQLYELRMDNAIDQAQRYGGRSIGRAGLLELSARCWAVLERWSPDGVQELQGIARGSGLDPLQVWALNGLTDLRDLAAFGLAEEAEGCTAALVAPGGTHSRQTLTAQTWDLATDNMPFVRVVRRRPEAAPATACLTLVGCLSLIGVNDRGVAVGTTNLRATDNRPGVSYLDALHRALACPTRAEALQAILRAPRSAAHFFYVADGDGATAVEATAHREVMKEVTGTYVHANHFLEPELVGLEVAGTPMASSRHRQARMEALLAEGPVDLARLRAALADREGADRAIERRDFGGISTNGATIVNPAERRLHAVHGPASGDWIQVDLGA